MKHFLIAGLLVAIGAVALVGPAHAASKYCIYNPDDPDCYGQGGYDDGGYPPPPPPPPQRHRFYGDDQYDQGDDGFYQEPRPRYQPVSRCTSVGQSLRRYGYRRIRPIDCGGKNYKYEAFRGYQRFIVKVKARSGRIIYEIRG
jgi:hypothetical protein